MLILRPILVKSRTSRASGICFLILMIILDIYSSVLKPGSMSNQKYFILAEKLLTFAHLGFLQQFYETVMDLAWFDSVEEERK